MISRNQYRMINLIDSNFTFVKILTFLDYLDQKMSDDHYIVKRRAVYYSLVPMGFNSPEMVDEIVEYVC